jgi:hypothetical protein
MGDGVRVFVARLERVVKGCPRTIALGMLRLWICPALSPLFPSLFESCSPLTLRSSVFSGFFEKMKYWPPRFSLVDFLATPIFFKVKWEKLKMLLSVTELM